MSVSEPVELEIPTFQMHSSLLITAPSFLIDRIVPDCEIISLPKKQVPGGVLRISRGPVSPLPGKSGVLDWLRGRRATRTITGQNLFDFRLHHPQNWAHFLTNHLPIFFRICEMTDLEWSDCLIVVPQNTPAYIMDAAEIFGLNLMAFDGELQGNAVSFNAEPWTGIRAQRSEWVRAPIVMTAVEAACRNGMQFPDRIFLSRRQTRTLSNETEVAEYLSKHGFVKIYPEDLDASDQIRLFHQAETIVAVHGAGLAPLLYCSDGGRLRQLVEILPCGHMTDVFRSMAQQVGCSWIGVRGKIKPSYVQPAYDLRADFQEFSLDTFEVDIKSLETAFQLAEHPITGANNV